MPIKYAEQIQGSNLKRHRSIFCWSALLGSFVLGYIIFQYSPFMKRVNKAFADGTLLDTEARKAHKASMRLQMTGGVSLPTDYDTLRRQNEYKIRGKFRDL